MGVHVYCTEHFSWQEKRSELCDLGLRWAIFRNIQTICWSYFRHLSERRTVPVFSHMLSVTDLCSVVYTLGPWMCVCHVVCWLCRLSQWALIRVPDPRPACIVNQPHRGGWNRIIWTKCVVCVHLRGSHRIKRRWGEGLVFMYFLTPGMTEPGSAAMAEMHICFSL